MFVERSYADDVRELDVGKGEESGWACCGVTCSDRDSICWEQFVMEQKRPESFLCKDKGPRAETKRPKWSDIPLSITEGTLQQDTWCSETLAGE